MPGSPAAGGGDPLREVLAGEVGDHGGEGADLVAGGLQFGAALQDRLESELLVFGQGVRVAGQPVRDFADGGRGRGTGFSRGGAGRGSCGRRGSCRRSRVPDLLEQARDAAVSSAGVGRVGLEWVELERVELAGSWPAASGPRPAGGEPARAWREPARRTSRTDPAARPPPQARRRPRPPRGQARLGRSGGRRRTSRRRLQGSATGGSGRRPAPRPARRRGPRLTAQSAIRTSRIGSRSGGDRSLRCCRRD